MSLDLSSDKTYWTGYGLAPIPDPRDDEVLSTVRPLVEGGPDAVAEDTNGHRCGCRGWLPVRPGPDKSVHCASTTVIPSLEEVQTFFETELPFFTEFDFEVESIEPDVGVVRFVYDDRWTRPYKIINGGTLMALADVAVYVAVFSRVGIVPLAVTNELKMNFLRPAIGGDVLARANLKKVGRRVAYGDVDVFMDGEPDRLVAHATSSYILPDSE